MQDVGRVVDEMRGKDINFTVTVGKPAVRVIRAYTEGGEVWPIENITVSGEVWDIKMEEKVGEIGCKVTEWGEIELTYPELGLGRYVFMVDGVSDDGERERIIEGYIGYEEPRYIQEEWTGETMMVVIGKERRKVLFGRNKAWEGMYNETIEARNEANEAKNEVIEKLRAAEEFMAGFKRAVSEVIRIDESGVLVIGDYWTGVHVKGVDGHTPYIGADGYWYANGQSLGKKAQGEDGITPSITIDGYWAIGNKKTSVRAEGRDGIDGTSVRRILVDEYAQIPQEGDTCNGGHLYYVALGGQRTIATGWVRLSSGGVFKVAGIEINASSAQDAVDKLAQIENATNVYAELDYSDSHLIRLTALEAGVAGNRITLETNDERVTLSGDTLTGGQILNPTSWEMYAWLEGQGDLNGEWVKVGEVSDIATRTIYGYTKLGTDETIEDGAPVGKDANGRMAVGAATEAVPGTGKLSTGVTVNAGGFVGLDANGAFRVRAASYHTSGTIGYSYSGIADVPCVGTMGDGSAGITWASHERGGAVIIADDINDSRSYAVLSTEYLKAYLASNYLGKTESWTQEQIIKHVKEALSGYYSKTESLNAQGVRDAINKALLNYYDKTAVEGQINAIARKIADAKLADYYNASESDARYVQTGKGGVMKLHAMYKSEFDQLATREANAVYFVKRNKS